MSKLNRPHATPHPPFSPVQKTPGQPAGLQARPRPAAPPVYRPQTAPPVLQRKAAPGGPAGGGAKVGAGLPPAPPPYRPHPTPMALQAKKMLPPQPNARPCVGAQPPPRPAPAALQIYRPPSYAPATIQRMPVRRDTLKDNHVAASQETVSDRISASKTFDGDAYEYHYHANGYRDEELRSLTMTVRRERRGGGRAHINGNWNLARAETNIDTEPQVEEYHVTVSEGDGGKWSVKGRGSRNPNAGRRSAIQKWMADKLRSKLKELGAEHRDVRDVRIH